MLLDAGVVHCGAAVALEAVRGPCLQPCGSLNLRNTGVKRSRLLLAFAGAQLAFEVGISLQLVLHVVKESL